MDEVERIAVELPHELAAELRDAVACSDYPSLDAALEHAVEGWWADRAIARLGIERLRERLERNIAAGGSRTLDGEDMIRRAVESGRRMRIDRRAG